LLRSSSALPRCSCTQRGLRAANEALRRGLTAAETRNQALSERVAEAKRRLDALVARLPEPAE
jgi:hypothetical protein